MGKQADGMPSTVRQFILGADSDYIAGKLVLLPGQLTAKQLRYDENHLLILCQFLKAELRAATPGCGDGGK